MAMVQPALAKTIDWTEVKPGGDTDLSWNNAGAMSSDGQKMVAGVSNGRLYLSDNGGDTWTETQPAGDMNANWIAAAMSSDGETILVGAYGTGLYLSTNGGDSWTNVGAGTGATNWYSSTISDDDQVLMAGTQNEGVFISSDNGDNWNKTSLTDTGATWVTMAASDTGSVLMAGDYNGDVSRSEDYGDTWGDATPVAATNWLSISMDDSGDMVLAGLENGRLYYSDDGAVLWDEVQPAGDVDRVWRIARISGTGGVMFAGSGDSTGRLYFSTNDGLDWIETQAAGDLDLAWGISGLSDDGESFLAGVTSGRLYVGALQHDAPPFSSTSSSASNNTSTFVPSQPGCGDSKPVGSVDLFQINRTGKSAKLFFTPVSDNVTQYNIVYGFRSGDVRFGQLGAYVTNEANRGVQSIVINDLDSNSSYWFQVLPVNGCSAGEWSNWLQAKVSKSGLMGFYRW
jgi:photosystem II stability/assembly factor-like uncharacterized protein